MKTLLVAILALFAAGCAGNAPLQGSQPVLSFHAIAESSLVLPVKGQEVVGEEAHGAVLDGWI